MAIQFRCWWCFSVSGKRIVHLWRLSWQKINKVPRQLRCVCGVPGNRNRSLYRWMNDEVWEPARPQRDRTDRTHSIHWNTGNTGPTWPHQMFRLDKSIVILLMCRLNASDEVACIFSVSFSLRVFLAFRFCVLGCWFLSVYASKPNGSYGKSLAKLCA